MLTLHSRIERAASGGAFGGPDAAVTFVTGDSYDPVTWREFHLEARSMAAAMQDHGVRPGHHVAILGPTTRNLVTAIQATWLCGGVLVMLPLPMRMSSLEHFVSQTRDRIRHADVNVVLIAPELAEFVEPVEGDPPFIGLDTLLPVDPAQRADPDAWRRPPEDPDALAILQFTSGSTSEPKGVMLSHRQICNNIDGAFAAARMHDDDTVVSWLPLYHDMGLIGLLSIPMSTGVGLVQGAPQDFLARPQRWMQWVSDHRGTITAGPNFSYVLATRALRLVDDLDLSRLRIALNGAEPVDADAFREFAVAGARFGMDERALFPAFGMAEVCIAGTFPEPGDGLRTDLVDSRVLEHEHFAATAQPGSPNARELAFLGRSVPGLNLRVVEPTTGKECRDREVGELQIRGGSLTSGYYRRPDATRELIVDGWLRTGDLAYLVDGELVICGRIKDVIIIGGRNIYPQDIEKAVGDVEGVRKGNVIAFGQVGRHSKQHVVVVAETKAPDPAPVQRAVVRRIVAEIGVPAREVVLVDAGTIPKTSSGKLQRSACREMYERGELGKVVEVGPAGTDLTPTSTSA